MRPWQILPRAALWLVVAAVAAAMLMPVIDIVIHGLPVLSWEFITENPRDADRSGGIASVLVSTALITGVSLAAAVPVAFGTAVLLSEYVPADGLLASLIRGSLDVLAGVPSVVFGLFGLTLLCRQLGLGYSIVAGGLTLACMILPTLTRTMYSAFDALGTQYRFAGSALGVSRMAILLYVSLPLALPAVTAGIVLGLTRALAETAVLLFTSGYSDRMPTSVFNSGRSISLHIYELATNVSGGDGAAYGSALVLIMLLGVASLCMHALSNRIQKKFISS
ncbi:PstA family ABC transporter permease [Massilia sp. Se16.2.3]|uniref:PstA family ABC transporter permease n=1 Tax=Massilia sp. Se16.2.3 TaxID=2709303 RepID=UPI001601D13C|nr:ABC transporter permease subunit [Massilia sp. Se16.2.3]QNA98172.1 ABC transporter permease subunit [Massilia sp. Se16.2.3]